jgi:hypothetical protein
MASERAETDPMVPSRRPSTVTPVKSALIHHTAAVMVVVRSSYRASDTKDIAVSHCRPTTFPWVAMNGIINPMTSRTAGRPKERRNCTHLAYGARVSA